MSSDCKPETGDGATAISARYAAAIGDGVDPAGTPWANLAPDTLRAERSSIKWTRYPDALPMFVAEMDFAVTPEIRREIIARIEASDTGYLDGPGPLAAVFADFARDTWGWEFDHRHVHLATDVAAGVVEALRVGRPKGGRIAVPVPVYPGFFEMLQEVPFEVVEVPLTEWQDRPASLDLLAIEHLFASEPGIDAFLLCNPHNPHGTVHSAEDLRGLARLAAKHDVFVVSDEIHAPLTHRGVTFTPFAPLAAAAGAQAIVATSASKGWNLAALKCSVLIAADERSNELLLHLPPETATRTSLLGLRATITALTDGRDWLARTVAQSEANIALFAALAAEQLPGVRVIMPQAGYVVWLDLREAGLGADPAGRILNDAGVALNNGRFFGRGGAGFARINLACAPDTIVEAVERISALQTTQQGDA